MKAPETKSPPPPIIIKDQKSKTMTTQPTAPDFHTPENNQHHTTALTSEHQKLPSSQRMMVIDWTLKTKRTKQQITTQKGN